jgi:hypothetical protein
MLLGKSNMFAHKPLPFEAHSFEVIILFSNFKIQENG